MNPFKANKVQVAVETQSQIDLSFDHYTTSDFFKIAPIVCREVLPRDKFTCSVESLYRLSAMPVAPFTRIKTNTRAFFVPMHAIWHSFDAFINGTIDYSQVGAVTTSKVPTFRNDDFVNILIENFTILVTSGVSDFTIVSGQDVKKYRFTRTGKILYSTLLSLGYSFNFSLSDQTEFSVLPLFAYLRVILDYYLPKQYQHNIIFTFFGSRTFSSTLANWNQIAQVCTACFDADYFTSAWSSPFGPQSSDSPGYNPSSGFNSNSFPVVPTPNNSSVISSVFSLDSNGAIVQTQLPESSSHYINDFTIAKIIIAIHTT